MLQESGPRTGRAARRVEFGLLGPLTARIDETPVPVRAAKQRVVLSALLLCAGRVVTPDELAEAVWGSVLPVSARVTVQNYVKRLRTALADGDRSCITTQSHGYQIHADASELDVTRFENLQASADQAARHGQWALAAARLREALALWRGQPLADVPSDLLVLQHGLRLAELHTQALEARIDADLHLGGHREVITELRELTAAHPLRERGYGLLMLALYRDGRQAEALALYQQAHRALTGELGVEPGPGLRELHQRMLAADTGLIPAGPWPSVSRAEPDAAQRRLAAAPVLVPRQLPAEVAHFAGRSGELAALAGLLEPAEAAPAAAGAPRPGTCDRPVVISAIEGTAGVGKTALALRFAHRVADQFPDGQLYVNLRGFGPSGGPVPAGQAIRGFLDALGVPAGRIPAGTDARAALYRSVLAGLRALIVLDNARDADQVRPLLPGSTGCLVIVTSRNQLTGLAATDGARLLTLDVLSEAEAAELLAGRLGTARVTAEPAAAAELASLCARLPLALSITAARAAARPGFPLAALAAELRDASGRLDSLEAGEPTASIRAVFSWSRRHLSAPAARMFWLLGIHPGPDITVPAAATLAGVTARHARRALDELTRSSLLAEHAPGRYAFHDLLRAYAAEQGAARTRRTERRAARRRMLDHYLHAGHAADRLLYPTRDPIILAPAAAGTVPERLAGHQQALAWFRDEHRVLLSVVSQAASTGFDTHAWQLPRILVNYLDPQGHWHDLAAVQETALAAAQRLGDLEGQAWAHRLLGRAQVRLGSLADADAHLGRALDLYQRIGDQGGAAHVRTYLAKLAEAEQRYDQALRHAEEGLSLFRACGNTAGEARALNSAGWCHVKLGDYRQALDCCQQALYLHTQLDNRQGQAATWDSIGYACHHLGRYSQASTSYQRALDLFRNLGNRYEEAETLTRLGDTSLAAGTPAAALITWQQALAILEDLHPAGAEAVRAKVMAARGCGETP
jgi:DNA-binding SARP family transcriptional activator